jgi:hypothetical protein
LEVRIGGQTIVEDHEVFPVGSENPYVEVTGEPFRAFGSTLELEFIKRGRETGGDNTALIDHVRFEKLEETGPIVTSISPSPLAPAVDPDVSIVIEIEDGQTEVRLSSILFRFDNQVVSPSIEKSGTTTTVRYDPSGMLDYGSPHSYELTFQDNAAEAQLAGTLIDPETEQPYDNVADLSLANPDGTFDVEGVVNFDHEFGGDAGNFTSGNGYFEEFWPGGLPSFDIGVRITEPALLSVKATRFPGEELLWDSKNAKFTNHDQANREIISRKYREGFAPPKVA